MSNIYFLGREDAEGLARLQSQKRGLLSYDAEVGGWDTPHANDGGIICSDFDSGMPAIRHNKVSEEPALRVFDSRVELTETDEKEPNRDDKPWPTITYQVRFGNDQ